MLWLHTGFGFGYVLVMFGLDAGNIGDNLAGFWSHFDCVLKEVWVVGWLCLKPRIWEIARQGKSKKWSGEGNFQGPWFAKPKHNQHESKAIECVTKRNQ